MLNRPIDPSTMIYDPDMKSVEAFSLGPQSTFDDMRILTAVNTMAERLTGMSDPAMGRETRQGGHPSPATSTLALLDQSEIMQGTTRELIRSQYSRLGEAIASLYQQFETNDDGKLQRLLGEGDAKNVEEFLFPTDPVSGSLMFDVTAMSSHNTPKAEMEKSILISQMNSNYWLMLIKGVQFLENPQVGPMVKEAIIGAIRASTKSHLRFLESGDIDDLERYVFSLAENERSGADDLREAAGRATEIAEARLGAQGGGVGGPGGVPTNGAAGPPQPTGGFQ
jgi:hypothetical protein